MSNYHVPTGSFTPGGAVGVGMAVGVGVGVGVAGAAGTATMTDDEFTADMRDRQARGKDPYESSDASSNWTPEGTRKHRAGGGKDESFSMTERRRVASQVLDSPELLMMAAQRDNESIPATRLRYIRMLCGFEEPPQPQSARKKSHRGGGGSGGSSNDSSRASGGSTPGRSGMKDTR
ncbi:uncharacterized protein F4812DRAFT_413654 [Daldinia caldariorum]|uniref:uncharacterized protein n=1 Tax=Daldinia caldariorum TaxID=326644 RepID=UPI002008462C|nr:uncharacterized protein F4812DRAFT_413654 [Daldinia caldariorum]KAI1471350.1 hypothetical protein F4812DRAFT_413654 [Daldinia caldariorum]